MEIRIENYIIDKPIIDLLNEINSLSRRKINDIKERKGELIITCPFHSNKQENTPSCFINVDKDSEYYGVYHCFGCGAKGYINKLLAKILECSVSTINNYLIENYGKYSPINAITLGEKIDLTSKEEKKEEVKYLDERILDKYESWHPYLEKRHLNREVCERFKVRYDKKNQDIVFPVWNENNKLVMLTRRNIHHKTFNIQKDIEKPVYLLNFITSPSVYVCESQINALTLWSQGKQAIALLGTGTKNQYEILNKSSINTFYLCFDGDLAGQQGTTRFIRNINQDKLVNIVLIPTNKDVNDLTEDEFNSLKIIEKNEWK